MDSEPIESKMTNQSLLGTSQPAADFLTLSQSNQILAEKKKTPRQRKTPAAKTVEPEGSTLNHPSLPFQAPTIPPPPPPPVKQTKRTRTEEKQIKRIENIIIGQSKVALDQLECTLQVCQDVTPNERITALQSTSTELKSQLQDFIGYLQSKQ